MDIILGEPRDYDDTNSSNESTSTQKNKEATECYKSLIKFTKNKKFKSKAVKQAFTDHYQTFIEYKDDYRKVMNAIDDIIESTGVKKEKKKQKLTKLLYTFFQEQYDICLIGSSNAILETGTKLSSTLSEEDFVSPITR